MTVAELIQELDRFDAERQVYVAIDREWCSKLLGVLGNGNRVILDPSANEDDREPHRLSPDTVTGARL